SEPSAGFLIEHTHRAFGYLVGCCVIVLSVGLRRAESRRWLRMLGFVALAAVIVQGLLGGFRVKLNELVGTDIAVLHGCSGQVVLALLVTIAVVTAPRGAYPVFIDGDRQRALRGAVVLAALAFVQIVFGVLVRQTASPLGQRGHLLTAFAVLGLATALTKETL